MKKVLLIGASGFLGSNLLQALIDQNYDVISLSYRPQNDIDFCNKIRSIAKKIIYSPKVKIRHKTRDLKNFFKQRFVYGFSIQNITKENFLC